jgi:arylsulfatase A-like enzyme
MSGAIVIARCIAVTAALLGSLACQPSRPDIVLVSIDSLRADHLGAYGYPHPTSPALDRIAAAGVTFDNAVSTTSWTLPAHAALFTGLEDSAHGVIQDRFRLASNRVTLAERLREAGYHTAGFYGGPYLSPGFGIAQGFDTWVDCQTPLARDATGKQRHVVSHEDVTGPRTLTAVEQWLSDVDDSRPFFLFVHLWDVHYDYQAPPEIVARFDPDYDGPVVGAGFETSPHLRVDMAERDRRHLLALYDAEIRFTDDVLGAIVSRIEAAGRSRETLFVITSDHGEEFFDHGRKGHQKSLFEEVVRIPLVFYGTSALKAETRVSSLASLVDVMPTLLAQAGVAPEAPGPGRDLSPALRGDPLPPGEALLELHVTRRHAAALRGEDWVLISEPHERPKLFDLASDPAQRSPRYEEDPRYADAVRSLHARAAAARAYIEANPPDDARSKIDRATLERLEALGYVDP